MKSEASLVCVFNRVDPDIIDTLSSYVYSSAFYSGSG